MELNFIRLVVKGLIVILTTPTTHGGAINPIDLKELTKTQVDFVNWIKGIETNTITHQINNPLTDQLKGQIMFFMYFLKGVGENQKCLNTIKEATNQKDYQHLLYHFGNNEYLELRREIFNRLTEHIKGHRSPLSNLQSKL